MKQKENILVGKEFVGESRYPLSIQKSSEFSCFEGKVKWDPFLMIIREVEKDLRREINEDKILTKIINMFKGIGYEVIVDLDKGKTLYGIKGRTSIIWVLNVDKNKSGTKKVKVQFSGNHHGFRHELKVDKKKKFLIGYRELNVIKEIKVSKELKVSLK